VSAARSAAVLLILVAAAVAAGAATGARAEPAFHASITRIGPEMRRTMVGVSWHRGCPVPLRRLRVLRVSHWGFGGKVRTGTLIVHRKHAVALRGVFRTLFEKRFRIRRMQPVDAYGGSDRKSMAANNTSAFNCRYVSGTTRWSEHAYGRAIDVNPIQNPWVSNGVASPPAGQPYVDRSRHRLGMIMAGGKVVRAFAAAGWRWGGSWSGPRDYQHFSSTGR
jgi:hypothetical protein